MGLRQPNWTMLLLSFMHKIRFACIFSSFRYMHRGRMAVHTGTICLPSQASTKLFCLVALPPRFKQDSQKQDITSQVSSLRSLQKLLTFAFLNSLWEMLSGSHPKIACWFLQNHMYVYRCRKSQQSEPHIYMQANVGKSKKSSTQQLCAFCHHIRGTAALP